MKPNIVLIGSVGAGKSTQAELLAQKLGIVRRPLDDLRWDYYREIGYDDELAKTIQAAEGFQGLYRYWKPFEVHAVERLLAEAQNSVIDFGAGHSVQEDEALFARVQRALKDQRVVHLLPSPDLIESAYVLKRWKWNGQAGEINFHDHFVNHPSNHRLANHVIYTLGKSPEQTRDEIIAALKLNTSNHGSTEDADTYA